jgi:hypothetical protein
MIFAAGLSYLARRFFGGGRMSPGFARTGGMGSRWGRRGW